MWVADVLVAADQGGRHLRAGHAGSGLVGVPRQSLDDQRRDEARAVALAPTDPANPYGAALPWPARDAEKAGPKLGRKAGALVMLVDGALVLYVERGGKTLLSFREDDSCLGPAVNALPRRPRRRAGPADRGEGRRCTGLHLTARARLEHADLRPTPRGLGLRA